MSIAEHSPALSTLAPLRQARERFLTGRPLPDGVPDEIVAAWRRARFFGVPHDLKEPAELPVGARPESALLAAARPVLERLAPALDTGRSSLALTDERLRVLWAAGSAPGDQPCTDLSEREVGHNSAALALRTRRRAEVHGPEHFLDLWQDVSAVSVPVLAPETGQVLGTVTVASGLCAECSPHPGAALAEAAAAAVEAELLARTRAVERVLLDAYLSATRGSAPAVVALDGRNRLVSEAAARLLSPEGLEVLERGAGAVLRQGAASESYGTGRGPGRGAPSEPHDTRLGPGQGAPSEAHDTRLELRRGATTEPHDTRLGLRQDAPTEPHDTRLGLRQDAPTEPNDTRLGLGQAAPTEPHDTGLGLGQAAPTEPHDTGLGLGRGAPSEPHDTRLGPRQDAPTEPHDTRLGLRQDAPTEPHDTRLPRVSLSEPVDTPLPHASSSEPHSNPLPHASSSEPHGGPHPHATPPEPHNASPGQSTPSPSYVVELPGGSGCTARFTPVRHLGSVIGLLAVLEPVGAGAVPVVPRAAIPVAGRSGPWRLAVGRATELAGSREPLLLTGERGTGKTTLARELLAEFAPLVVDAAEGELGSGYQELAEGRPLLLRHAERLAQPDVAALNSLLHENPGAPLLVTYTPGPPAGPCLQRLLDTLAARAVALPALRERPEDIRELLAALAPKPAQGQPPLTWTLDALRALEQHPWPGNVTELAHLVRALAEDRRTVGPVRRAELPDLVREGPATRRLSPMEHAERTAILEALRRHGGNKARTAAALGIGRATLYRKLRGYRDSSS
ncbi:helix-turn-helix domain-containing protein [Streptomyces sp. NPDC058614]|uniref:helix-turn-helix domain-containing protein n=1 Tax=Streptomyces sp. NPDC058614 TaxID=3346557 RepID=UPI00365B3CBB